MEPPATRQSTDPPTETPEVDARAYVASEPPSHGMLNVNCQNLSLQVSPTRSRHSTLGRRRSIETARDRVTSLIGSLVMLQVPASLSYASIRRMRGVVGKLHGGAALHDRVVLRRRDHVPAVRRHHDARSPWV